MNKMTELAAHCNNGACNILSILNSLAEAHREIELWNAKDCVELKIIIGHLGFLLGETIGPSLEAVEAFESKLQPVT